MAANFLRVAASGVFSVATGATAASEMRVEVLLVPQNIAEEPFDPERQICALMRTDSSHLQKFPVRNNRARLFDSARQFFNLRISMS